MNGEMIDNVTKLLNSPPGQVVAGGVLFGVVYKLFERVENVLTDDTKLEIAVWLLGVKSAEKVTSWPRTFSKVFDAVFGLKHLSIVCFFRSCIVSSAILFLCYLHSFLQLRARLPTLHLTWHGTALVLGVGILANAMPDYLSLLKTRSLIGVLPAAPQRLWILVLALDVGIDVIFAYLSLIFATVLLLFLTAGDYAQAVTMLPWSISEAVHFRSPPEFLFWFYPAFFTSVWLWLYASSGFILTIAGRFDLGLNWLNRHFDVEKKPLQSIGLVSAALVAVAYWCLIAIEHIVQR
jgi:hypothetical protein